MTRKISEILDAGWEPIDGAPKDGSRVRVGHHGDLSSLKPDTICPTHGVWENGEWACDSAFVCVDGMLRFQPTLWLPSESARKQEAGHG